MKPSAARHNLQIVGVLFHSKKEIISILIVTVKPKPEIRCPTIDMGICLPQPCSLGDRLWRLD